MVPWPPDTTCHPSQSVFAARTKLSQMFPCFSHAHEAHKATCASFLTFFSPIFHKTPLYVLLEGKVRAGKSSSPVFSLWFSSWPSYVGTSWDSRAQIIWSWPWISSFFLPSSGQGSPTPVQRRTSVIVRERLGSRRFMIMKMSMPGTLPKLCDPQEAPLKLNSAPLPPPLRAGILLIFSSNLFITLHTQAFFVGI